jgi:hypothetical protein
MKKPNFFIIGAPKCGTTAIAQYLAEHPEVFMSDPKEPHHYNTDIRHGKYKDATAYFDLFKSAGDECKAIGEGSVWYLYSREAVANILKDLPDAKFIVMIRNPIEMAPSLHEQMVFSGVEDEQDFFRAWMLQADREEGRKIPAFCTDNKLLLYRSACSLGEQLARLKKTVPEENLLVIFFDDFKESPRSVWLEIERFLNIADDMRNDFPVVNSAKERKSMLMKRINDSYARVRQFLGIGNLGTGVLSAIGRWNIRERKRPQLPSGVKDILIKEFEKDIRKLEEISGRDLSGWLK